MSGSLRGKVQRLVALETDRPELLEALDSVAQFYSPSHSSSADYSSTGRHTLRGELSKKNYTLACQFLQGLDRIRERVETAQKAVVALESSAEAIHSRIETASKSMRSFLEDASRLEKQRNELREQAAKIEAFLEQYQLTDEEIHALHREPVDRQRGEPFFAALERLDVIRAETNRLVGSEHQGTGFELLDVLSAHQEKAFARLYSWVQDQAGHLDTEAAEADPVMQKAVRTLYATPTFYKHCQDIVISVRKVTVVKNFVAALSYQGNQNENVPRKVRPLDIHANDPVRYASDMLAWTHQCIVTERELARSLFQTSGDSSSPGGAHEVKHSENVEGPLTLQQMLREILEGLGAPLELRLAQVVENAGGRTLDAYKMSGLLSFYCITLGEVLGSDSSVVEAISRCRGDMNASFQRLLGGIAKDIKDHLKECLMHISGSSEQRRPTGTAGGNPLMSLDLQPSATLKDTFQVLSMILTVSTTALTPASEEEADVSPILVAFLRPFVDAQESFLARSQKMSDGGSGEKIDVRLFADSSCDEAIFFMNCFMAAKRVLEPAEPHFLLPEERTIVQEKSLVSLQHWAKTLSEGTAQLRQVVVDLHSRRILEKTGLGALLDARANAIASEDGAPLSEYPTLSLEAVRVVIDAFNGALFTIFVPDFERIIDPDEKNTARVDTMTRVADGYASIWEMVMDDRQGYEDRTFLVHTPEQVRILLDV